MARRSAEAAERGPFGQIKSQTTPLRLAALRKNTLEGPEGRDEQTSHRWTDKPRQMDSDPSQRNRLFQIGGRHVKSGVIVSCAGPAAAPPSSTSVTASKSTTGLRTPAERQKT